MKKYFSISFLFLLLFIAKPVQADVLPEGQKTVPLCTKVTNLSAFPDHYFIGIEISPSKTISIHQIKENECDKGYYKFSEYKNFAVQKSQFAEADFSSIKSFDEARLISFDRILPNNYLPDPYLQSLDVVIPESIKSFEDTYKLKSITANKNGVIYKTSRDILYKDGSHHRLEYDEEGKIIKDILPDHIFTDVTPETPYAKAILYLRDNGAIKGYENGLYEPTKLINRAEFATLLVRGYRYADSVDVCAVKNSKSGENFIFFPDVLKNLWYSNFVCFAKTNDMIKGYPDGLFWPDRNINLAEAYKIALTTFYIADTFDETVGNAWYDTYFKRVYNEHMDLYENMDLSKEITRGEMAQIIYLTENDGHHIEQAYENPYLFY